MDLGSALNDTNYILVSIFPGMEGDAGNAGSDDAGGTASGFEDGVGHGKVSYCASVTIGGGVIEGVGICADEGAGNAEDANGAVSDQSGTGGADLS
jgi:hypothetical protein